MNTGPPSRPNKLVDLDTARLIRFRNNSLKVDIQQTVYQVGAANMNIFRKLEFTLKIAFSDALIQVSALFLLGGMGAFYDKQIILRGNFQFALGKTGNGNRDAVVVLVY